MWVEGHGFGFPVGRSGARHDRPGPADRHRRAQRGRPAGPRHRPPHAADEERDDLYGVDLTHLRWDATEALTAEHALERTVLAGNLVPAVEGRRFTETFVIDPDPLGQDALAQPSRAAARTPAAATRTRSTCIRCRRAGWRGSRARTGSRRRRSTSSRAGGTRRSAARLARGVVRCSTPMCSSPPIRSTRSRTETSVSTAAPGCRGSSTTATAGTRCGSAPARSASAVAREAVFDLTYRVTAGAAGTWPRTRSRLSRGR